MTEPQLSRVRPGDITTLTAPLNESENIKLRIWNASITALTKSGLAQVDILGPSKIRDYSPRVLVDDTGTIVRGSADLSFLLFLTRVAQDEYETLFNKTKDPIDIVERTVLDRIQGHVDSFSKNNVLYEAFTNYLVQREEKEAKQLVSALTLKEGGVVDIVDKPLVASLMEADMETSPVFVEAIWQSNDNNAQNNLSQKLMSAFGDLLDNELDIKAPFAEFQIYFDPLVAAASKEDPNFFAVQHLINFYKTTLLVTGNSADPVDNSAFPTRRDARIRSIQPSQELYKTFRNIQELILRTAFLSSQDSLHEMAFDYFHSQKGSLEAQLSHFFAVLDTYILEFDSPNSNLEAWIDNAYPKDSPLRKIVSDVFKTNLKKERILRGILAGQVIAFDDEESPANEKEYRLRRLAGMGDLISSMSDFLDA